MRKIEMSWDEWQGRLGAWFRLLLERRVWVTRGIVVLGGIVAVAVLVGLLRFEGEKAMQSDDVQGRIPFDKIDSAKEWILDREGSLERGLNFNRSVWLV